MEWSKLLNTARFGDILNRPKRANAPYEPGFAHGQFRLPSERDHDRVLFSTPFRRMGDKTQVFPLESIESIRTRLTHSYEVSNLARSVGIELAVKLKDRLPEEAHRSFPAMLAAVGLAHDIGNPPFGHQGENAIRAWFKRNEAILFDPTNVATEEMRVDVGQLTEQHRQDFLHFEGNAQTIRVLTKLQVINDDLGLNLTLGTLAALMKYVAQSDKLSSSSVARKKVGYFASEQSLVSRVRDDTGLTGDARHPLALIMEACDDIAYSVLDAEDSIKKGLVSFNDLLAWLRRRQAGDAVIRYVHERAAWDHEGLAEREFHPTELNDVSTQLLRVNAIHVMVAAVVDAFIRNYDDIMAGSFDKELIKVSEAAGLCKAFKDFDRENAFSHRTVLEVELNGYNTINRLMDFLWLGISQRKDYSNPASDRIGPFATYVYSRISRNYRRVFEGKVMRYHQDGLLPIRYRELQLLTDMMAGMTDKFCMDLFEDLSKHYSEIEPIDATFS